MNIFFLLRPKTETSFIYDDSTLRQGIEKAQAHGFTSTPVISRDGRYVGTVTQGNMIWAVMDCFNGDRKSLEKVKIMDVMEKDFCPSVTIEASMDELLEHITNQNFVPIVDDRGMFVGIVTRKTVINYLRDNKK